MDWTLLESILTPVAAPPVSLIVHAPCIFPPMPEMVALALFSSAPSVPDEMLTPMPVPACPNAPVWLAPFEPPAPPVPVIEPLLVMVATFAVDTLMPMPAAPAPPLAPGMGDGLPLPPSPPTPEIEPLLVITPTVSTPGAIEDTLMPVPTPPSPPAGDCMEVELAPFRPVLEMLPWFSMKVTGANSPPEGVATPGPPTTLMMPPGVVTSRLLAEASVQVAVTVFEIVLGDNGWHEAPDAAAAGSAAREPSAMMAAVAMDRGMEGGNAIR
ncbi:hypothetical protein [Cupriavidus sp. PET2-C1]